MDKTKIIIGIENGQVVSISSNHNISYRVVNYDAVNDEDLAISDEYEADVVKTECKTTIDLLNKTVCDFRLEMLGLKDKRYEDE